MSKLFFDLQDPALAAQYRSDPEPILGRYPLEREVREKILARDAAYLSKRTNAYLLRYFFFAIGMKDDEFARRLRDG